VFTVEPPSPGVLQQRNERALSRELDLARHVGYDRTD
jgi:hypothetical protein